MGKSATRLQEAPIKVVAPAKCAEQYADVKGALIDERVLCAADTGKDACQVLINIMNCGNFNFMLK